MKKAFATFVLLFVFSISIFADGHIGEGGRTCPNGQTTCFVGGTEPEPAPEDPTIIETVFDYLNSLFG